MHEGPVGDRFSDARARPVLAAKARLQIDKVSKAPMLLYPEGIIQLNPTGAAIVALCDGQHTLQDMLNKLALRYKTVPAELRNDVKEFLHALHRESLLEFLL